MKNSLNQFAKIGIISCCVEVEKSSNEIISLLNDESEQIKKEFTLENFTLFKPISDSRSVYSALGRNPSRYPVSSEALIKRVLNGKGLYFINNIVEINNLLSLQSGFSVGSYDSKNINSEIDFRKGINGDKYKGIGKAEFELDNLPLLSDRTGAFGSPTSDSERTMITSKTKEIIMVIYGFGSIDLTEWLNKAAILLKQFANASNIQTNII